MGMQMYIVTLKDGFNPDSSREVQQLVRQKGGLILMVTRNGPFVALDDSAVASVAQHQSVGFIGPVTLNPRGFAAERIQQIMAENLSKQLAIKGPGEPDQSS